MFADILAVTYRAAEIRNAKGYESYGSAYTYGRSHQEHYHQQAQCLMGSAQFRLAPEMRAELFVVHDGGCDTCRKQTEGEDDIPACHAFHLEIGRSPKVLLFQQIRVRCVGYDNGSERPDERAEDDTECNQILGGYFERHKEAHQCAYKGADE